MYNPEIKNRYINRKESETILNKHLLKGIFEKTEKYENELNKDVCNFSYYDISEFYKMIGSTSLGSLNSMNSQLSQYTSWCIHEGFVEDGQNHFSEFSSSILKNYLNIAKINNTIITREEIISLCNKLSNARDCFIILSLFEYGKSKNFSDISYARFCDIEGNILKLKSGRSVIISEQLKSIAEESYNSTSYVSIDGNRTFNLIDDGTIIKHRNEISEASEFAAGRKIYNLIVKIFNIYGLNDMSANNIVMSGILNMILEKSQKYGISPMQYLDSDYISEIENQYGVNRYTFKSNFVMTYTDYLK
jgi:hypothetical protein